MTLTIKGSGPFRRHRSRQLQGLASVPEFGDQVAVGDHLERPAGLLLVLGQVRGPSHIQEVGNDVVVRGADNTAANADVQTALRDAEKRLAAE